MTATNFKTAEELGIQPWEHEALLWVLDEMEMGRITHSGADPSSRKGLDMNRSHRDTICGTVCCIGGWMHYHKRGSNQSAIDAYVCSRGGALNDLFFPLGIVDWSNIGPEHAVPVIRHYLETTKVDWAITGLKHDLGDDE